MIGAVVFNTAQILHQITLPSDQKRITFFWRLLKIDFVIRYYSLIMPTAATVFLRWHFFNSLGVNKTSSGIAVVSNKFLNMFYIFFFTGVTLGFSKTIHITLETLELSVAFAFVLLSAIFFLALIISLETQAGAKFISKNSFLLYKTNKINLFKAFLKRGFISTNEFKRKRSSNKHSASTHHLLILLIWPALSFLCVAFSQQMVMNSIGINIGYIDALVVRAAVLFALMLPFSFAGIGLREASIIGILTLLYDTSAPLAFAASLVLFFFQILISFIGFILSVLPTKTSR